jgi:hypothetical protein
VTVASTGACSGPNCTYSITPAVSEYGPIGGSGTVYVLTSPQDCGWFATSASDWIHITSGSSGVGNGSVEYTVDQNNGTYRFGWIQVQGRIHGVYQYGAALFSDGFESGDTSAW